MKQTDYQAMYAWLDEQLKSCDPAETDIINRILDVVWMYEELQY